MHKPFLEFLLQGKSYYKETYSSMNIYE